MSYESVVARLRASIDVDHDSNHETPDIDGNAAAMDEVTAKALLDRLVAAHARLGSPPTGTSSSPSYNQRLAARAVNIEQGWLAWQRSCRALTSRLMALAPRYAETEPVPVDLRGLIVNEVIRGLDPDYPETEPESGFNTVGWGRRARELFEAIAHGEYAPACQACDDAARDYDVVRRSPLPRKPFPTLNHNSSATNEYLTALREAEAYVAYLDAVSAPGVE